MNQKVVATVLIVSLAINLLLLWWKFQPETEAVTGDTDLAYSVSGYENDPEQQLIDVINQTESELNIAIYNLDNKDIAEAIAAAAERGVTVRILADGENTSNEDSQEILEELAGKGIEIKINTNEKMHLKLSVADAKTVVTGSFNYTKDSAEDNQEVLVTIENTEFATSMNETFNEMWNSSELEEW